MMEVEAPTGLKPGFRNSKSYWSPGRIMIMRHWSCDRAWAHSPPYWDRACMFWILRQEYRNAFSLSFLRPILSVLSFRVYACPSSFSSVLCSCTIQCFIVAWSSSYLCGLQQLCSVASLPALLCIPGTHSSDHPTAVPPRASFTPTLQLSPINHHRRHCHNIACKFRSLIRFVATATRASLRSEVFSARLPLLSFSCIMLPSTSHHAFVASPSPIPHRLPHHASSE